MSGHNPYESEVDREERDTTRQLSEQLTQEKFSEDVVWLTSGPRGRRILRRWLRDAGVDLFHASIKSSFNANYGSMCLAEGARTFGLRIVAELSRALAFGELPIESWQALVMEKDDG